MENKSKHLELIQNVIERMANNCFLIKGWCITLLTGIIVVAVKNSANSYLYIAFMPLICFWILDSYYLMLERNYRVLYNHVSQLEEKDINFRMNIQDVTAEKLPLLNS